MSIFLALRILYGATLLVVCVLAFRSGGRAERIGAGVILVGSLLTLIAQQPPLFDWRFARTGLLVVDLGVLVAFLALALRSERFWPLWATAFHLVAFTTHLVMLIQPERVLQAYAIAQGFWAYPMMAVILVGVRGEARRRQTALVQRRDLRDERAVGGAAEAG